MKNSKFVAAALLGVSAATASADSLYYVGDDAQESLPLKWAVGLNAIWDDNVTPTVSKIDPITNLPNDGYEDEAFSLNPYVGVTFTSVTPQSTLDVYARLGVIYYLDEPEAAGTDDAYTQARLGVDYTHRFSERLRWTSRNFIAYELEPDYSYGTPTSRQTNEYLYWNLDNAIGYRFTERFATYTGVVFSGVDYDSSVKNSDRTTWEVYEQLRYQWTPQTVLLGEYRYADTSANGVASDSSSHYLSVGAEHRFSPNTTGIIKVGVQKYEADDGGDNTSPYAELGLNSRVNSQFMVRTFLHYGIEPYDTVQTVPNTGGALAEFDDHPVLRVGVSGEYTLSPIVTLFGGVNYINTEYDDGRFVVGGGDVGRSFDEDIINAYIGTSVKIVDGIFANASYNYTNSSSDIDNRDYDRNQVTVGVRAEF